jgi:hypothetical protein
VLFLAVDKSPRWYVIVEKVILYVHFRCIILAILLPMFPYVLSPFKFLLWPVDLVFVFTENDDGLCGALPPYLHFRCQETSMAGTPARRLRGLQQGVKHLYLRRGESWALSLSLSIYLWIEPPLQTITMAARPH